MCYDIYDTEMGLWNKFKFWRRRRNRSLKDQKVSTKYRNINFKMGICYWLRDKPLYKMASDDVLLNISTRYLDQNNSVLF